MRRLLLYEMYIILQHILYCDYVIQTSLKLFSQVNYNGVGFSNKDVMLSKITALICMTIEQLIEWKWFTDFYVCFYEMTVCIYCKNKRDTNRNYKISLWFNICSNLIHICAFNYQSVNVVKKQLFLSVFEFNYDIYGLFYTQ